MNTLTKENWEDLRNHIAAAKTELNSACEILAANFIYSPLGREFEQAIEQADTLVGNAAYAAQKEQERLMKEASEEKA